MPRLYSMIKYSACTKIVMKIEVAKEVSGSINTINIFHTKLDKAAI